MSSTVRSNSTAQKNSPPKPNQANAKINSLPFVKKEKRVTMIPTSPLDVVVSAGSNSGLRDPMMLAFGIPGQKVVQYTIHRRIGIDDRIRDNDWVFTQSSDIPGFLENQKDVRIGEVNQQVAAIRLDYLLRLRALEKGEDGKILYQGTDIERSKARNQASAAFKAYKEANPEGPRKLDDFFEEDTRPLEEHITELLGNPTLVKRIDLLKQKLETFVTLGGPSGSVRQKAIPSLRGVTNRGKIMASMIQLLWTAGVDEDPVEPTAEISGAVMPSDDEVSMEDLRVSLDHNLEQLRVERKLLKSANPSTEEYDEIQTRIEEIRMRIESLRRQITELEDEADA